MAQLLASGNTEVRSDEFTLVEGQSATVYLFGHEEVSDPHARVQIKCSDGSWTNVATLTKSDPVAVVQAAGTLSVYRLGCPSGNFGVDKN